MWYLSAMNYLASLAGILTELQEADRGADFKLIFDYRYNDDSDWLVSQILIFPYCNTSLALGAIQSVASSDSLRLLVFARPTDDQDFPYSVSLPSLADPDSSQSILSILAGLKTGWHQVVLSCGW